MQHAFAQTWRVHELLLELYLTSRIRSTQTPCSCTEVLYSGGMRRGSNLVQKPMKSFDYRSSILCTGKSAKHFLSAEMNELEDWKTPNRPSIVTTNELFNTVSMFTKTIYNRDIICMWLLDRPGHLSLPKFVIIHTTREASPLGWVGVVTLRKCWLQIWPLLLISHTTSQKHNLSVPQFPYLHNTRNLTMSPCGYET